MLKMQSLLFKDHPSPMFVYNLETLEIIEANRAAVDLYGYSEDEFRGLSVDKLGVAEKGFFSFISNGDTGIDLFDSRELRHRNKNGETFHVKLSHQDVSDDAYGESTNARLVVVHDIAPRGSSSQYQSAYSHLDTLVSNSPLAMVVWDENFRIKEWSPRAEEMTGYKKEEVQGKTPYIFDFHDLQDIFRISEKIQGIVGGRVQNDQLETKIYTRDRSVINIKVHASAVRDEKGRLISVLTFIEDLTDRKKIEARYEQLFEGSSDGICIIKGNEIIDCNAQLENIFGAAKEDIIGKTPFDFSPEKQPGGAVSQKKGLNKIKLALQGAPQVFEWKHKKQDGELVDSEVRLKRIEINEEQHVQAIVSDLTRQKEIERKIALRGEMFTELFNNSPIGIVMMDSDNKVTMANSAFEEMFGYSIDELEGNNVDDLIVTKELKKEAEDITDSTQHGQQFNIESVRVRKDGTPLDVIIGGVPVYSGGSQVAIYGIYVDITERKSSEKLLQHSLKEKEILLAEVHHRVKNNMAIVSGLLQLQTFNVEDDEKLKKHLQDSQLRIHSMAIVHEMLYQSETLSEISVGSYMEKLAEMVSGTLDTEEKDIEVVTDTDDIILNVNQAIPCALIVNELITNAYEYAFEGRDGGTIQVNVHQQGEKILTEVRDDGIGLPPDFDEKKKKSLGIYLVNTLGQQLEADLDVDSGNWGTSFTMTFDKSNKPGSSSSHKIHKNGVQREELMT